MLLVLSRSAMLELEIGSTGIGAGVSVCLSVTR